MEKQVTKINENDPDLLMYHSSTIMNVGIGIKMTIYMTNKCIRDKLSVMYVHAYSVYETMDPREIYQIGNTRYYTENKKYLTGYNIEIKKPDESDIIKFEISTNNVCMITQFNNDKNIHSVLTLQNIIEHIYQQLDVFNADPKIFEVLKEFIENLQQRLHYSAILRPDQKI